MKNKKGFTLIELLAVIVILAIIALIAVPVVLNMIKTAKRKGAIASTYGYVDSVNNYQEWNEFEGKDVLSEGQYNVATKTNSIDRINDLVRIKGSKPTAGTISISSSHHVSGATLCYNGFIINYLNNEAKIVGEDCDELGLITNISLEEEGWQKERKVTVYYPEGDYKYYYKVSGAAVMSESDQSIDKNKDLEATNPLKITLKENQVLTTWLVKNGNKKGLTEYNEKQIDNVEIIEAKVNAVAGYPKLTEYGVISSVNLEITNSNAQEGTSPYYSIDSGKSWIKYENSVSIETSSIKVKMVRDGSKRENEIKDVSITNGDLKNVLGSNAYDDDVDSYYSSNQYMYLDVDSTARNKNLSLLTGGYTRIEFLDSSGKYISHKNNFEGLRERLEVTIPNNATKIGIVYANIRNGDASTGYYSLGVYDLKLITKPILNTTEVIPVLKDSGFVDGYNKFDIKYYSTAVEKYYKIDDSEWKKYTGIINVPYGSTVCAKSKDKYNKESETECLQSKVVKGISNMAYNGSLDNKYESNQYMYFNVDSSMVNKKFKLYTGGYTRVEFINSSGECMSYVNNNRGLSYPIDVTIPNNTVKIGIVYSNFKTGAASPGYYSLGIYDIIILDEPIINLKEVLPIMKSSGFIDGYNNVSIDFFSTSVEKYYKIDDSEWKTYSGVLKVPYNKNICAKSKDKNGQFSREICVNSKIVNGISNMAYNGSLDNKYESNQYMYFNVDSSMINKKFKLYTGGYTRVEFINSSGECMSFVNNNSGLSYPLDVIVPNNTVKIGIVYSNFKTGAASTGYYSLGIYDIKILNN